MTVSIVTLSGAGLALVLGLRHGLDPDHISAIDGMTLQGLERGDPSSGWVGSLFALGHGAVVTAVAVGASLLGRRFALPSRFIGAAEWLPIMLLLAFGLLNLRSLRGGEAFRARGWKGAVLPRRLSEASGPLAVLLVGVLFAVAFDTASQAIAWGYAATACGGPIAALGVGLVFTLGMVATDTLDCRLLCRLVDRTAGDALERYRRAVGRAIVALSLGMAAYGALALLLPKVQLGAAAYSALGLALVLLLAGIPRTKRAAS